jgi:hypothetical protein
MISNLADPPKINDLGSLGTIAPLTQRLDVIDVVRPSFGKRHNVIWS